MAQSPNIPAIRNTGQFTDVPIADPYEAFLLYAEKSGIITATAHRQLTPRAQVSRASFLVMLARAFHLETSTTIPFQDVDAKSWYAQYVQIAQSYHLFVLSDETKLDPEKPVSMKEVNRALLLISAFKGGDVGPIRIEANQGHPSATPPVLYTVRSVRRQKTSLVAAPSTTQTPLVRRSLLARPLSIEEKRKNILTMINQLRNRNGLSSLEYNTALETSAQRYADQMVQEGFFAHVSPNGKTVLDRIHATGFTDKTYRQDCRCIPGYAIGENLAKGQKTAEEAVNDWMKSPEHKAAILNPVYTHTGIGLNAGIWVEHFGGLVLP